MPTEPPRGGQGRAVGARASQSLLGGLWLPPQPCHSEQETAAGGHLSREGTRLCEGPSLGGKNPFAFKLFVSQAEWGRTFPVTTGKTSSSPSFLNLEVGAEPAAGCLGHHLCGARPSQE